MRVDNCYTLKGAYIKGMQHEKLKDVVEKYITRDYPIEDILSRADQEHAAVDCDGLTGAYGDIYSSLTKVRHLADVIVKDAEKVMLLLDGAGAVEEVTELVAKIQTGESALFDESVDVVFMWETVAEYTHELKKYIRSDSRSNSLDQMRGDLKSIIATYTRIAGAAARFVPIMERSLESVANNRVGMQTTVGG